MSRKKEHAAKKENAEPAPETAAPQTPAQAAEPEGPAAPELARVKDQMIRLQADFENYRRRVERERSEVYQRANEDLMTELLQVLDHFEIGLKTAEKHHADKSVLDGFRMVSDQLMAALSRFGLTPLEAEGQDFDPHRHEAVTHMPSEEHPENIVIAQTRRGYLLGDRLLRAAQVVVSSGPANPAPAAEEKEGEANGGE
ncbi:MAG: nucleotide exchange factor GrpE [Kiritimatiellia bacterium]